MPGFGPWSVKAGVTHVQPPAAVLLARIAHGPACISMTAAPTTARSSSFPAPIFAASSTCARIDPVDCDRRAVAMPRPAGRRGVLMRPLIFHASRKATIATHRRVLHLEFAADPLPGPAAVGEGVEM